ncbi:Sterol-4-alpha-carboxylate 3-dehydrogenase decarboxylating [Nymphaea thermarum]|nr:Sterol-4-alpha-carboxylate 3-dehydrogenase decarboxylating [Nymphaea thermarum]
MDGQSRVLVIGGTGYIGKFIVKASAASGHPTFALVRDTSPSDPAKSQLLHSFTSSGVTLLRGSLDDHQSLVQAIKQVDVVISAVGSAQISQQVKIIAAIKEAGDVKVKPRNFNFSWVQHLVPYSFSCLTRERGRYWFL